MTAEHLKMLEGPACASLLGEAASQLAQGEIPEEIVRAIRLGRLTALQNLMEGSGASLWEMSSVGWSQGP